MNEQRELIRARFNSYSAAEQASTLIQTLAGSKTMLINGSEQRMSGDDDLASGLPGIPLASNLGTGFPFLHPGVGVNETIGDYSASVAGMEANSFVLEAWVTKAAWEQAQEMIRAAGGQM